MTDLEKATCTHFVLYVKNIILTRDFYVNILGCSERRFSEEESFLSIHVGEFIINFYGFKDKDIPDSYYKGVAHIGFELPSRRAVDNYFRMFKGKYKGYLSSSEEELKNSYKTGPYRFHVKDPDGYVIEIHSWEGVE